MENGVCVVPAYLDLSEVDRFADQLVILRQLFTRRQLDENLAQLSAVTAEMI